MINIGSRRELFFDDFMVDTEKSTVSTVYNKPVKRERLFDFDAPWETGAGYQNITKKPDGSYLMYYKTGYQEPKYGKHVSRIAVIESKDGIHWTRPMLDVSGIERYPVSNMISGDGDFYDNLFCFYDTNPDCPENERYKAFYGEWGNALFGFKGADGYKYDFYPADWDAYPHTTNFGDYPPPGDPRRYPTVLMTANEARSYFDSLNTVHYLPEKGKYMAFVRGFHVGEDDYPPDPDIPEAKRDIRWTESEDMVHWTVPERLEYEDGFDYQTYTNCIQSYYRAPHIMVGFPTRYVPRPEWNDSFDKLPNPEFRRIRGRGKSITDNVFMTSRDGKKWTRCNEAFMTPGPEQPNNWIYGDCYVCFGMIETPSDIPGADPVLSMYGSQRYKDQPCGLYRYEMRIDGFAAKKATLEPQKLVTKPFVFEGKELEINFATSALGYIKFTLRAEDGTEIHTSEVFGDKIDRIVGFDDGSVADFAGKTVVLEAEMSDASLYSFKFN
ncbi:MAG: hypothetical protein IJC50_09500 [Clostridia bacterium]|nr:hypothetical protein [Clostridia bacterium]